MRIAIKILNKEFYRNYEIDTDTNAEWYCIPEYATLGSAAVDLLCTEDVTIYPGETKVIHTGLAIWIGSSLDSEPVLCTDYGSIWTGLRIAGLIVPRSGLGTKGLILANTIGLIDDDYQGELIIQAWNRNNKDEPDYINEHYIPKKIKLKAGDRIAQLMFVPVIKAQLNIVEEFSRVTDRNTGGFGSTGE